MREDSIAPANIDEYIALYPPNVQKLLGQVRSVIRKTAPAALETIKYQIPTFSLHGNLVHFGAFKNHIGFYPAPSGLVEFKDELSVYNSGKGSIQFPIEKKLPLDLIIKIVKFRVNENLGKAGTKGRKKPEEGDRGMAQTTEK